MADKTVIYCQQPDELRIPVTVRIEWLPDGTIKPRLFWTPDGSCFKVRYIFEMVPCAFLKDKGKGIRFKVRGELIETPESDDFLHTQYETYLYFADDRYCGKNFIDERYAHEGKEYIPVTLDVFPDSDYELICFSVQGLRYMVERTVAIEPRGNFTVGGVGVRHMVEARQVNVNDDEDPDPYNSVRRPAALYFEVNKWFVTVNTS